MARIIEERFLAPTGRFLEKEDVRLNYNALP
jgi:hypothetical protein